MSAHVQRWIRALLLFCCLPFSLSRLRRFVRLSDEGYFAFPSGDPPQLSWAQDGEDLLWKHTLPERGFYVDVGAHHPFRFSVTKVLYDLGWSGVNIDVTSGFSELFGRFRPRDTNIEGLIGAASNRSFWRFQEPALNTLDGDVAQQAQIAGWPLDRVTQEPVRPLSSVLDEVVGPRRIDLLCVDVEGADLEVLESLDWKRYPVERCLVEVNLPAWEVESCPVGQFLVGMGYRVTRVWQRSALFEHAFLLANELPRRD